MEEAKKDLLHALVEAKFDYPYNVPHNFNLDGELMIEITLDEYRSLVSDNAILKTKLDFLKGSVKNGEIHGCSCGDELA